MKHMRLILLIFVLLGPGVSVPFCADDRAPIVQSMGHVALDVSDLKAALHFYVDQLGLKEAFRFDKSDGTPWLIDLRVGDTDTFVELVVGKKKPPPEPWTSDHFGLFVKDLQATLHALKERGYPLPDDAFKEAAKVPADNSPHYFIKDPDGNRIELSQLRPDSIQVTSRHKPIVIRLP